MFKFLKKKIKDAVKSFSSSADEDIEEVSPAELTQEQEAQLVQEEKQVQEEDSKDESVLSVVSEPPVKKEEVKEIDDLVEELAEEKEIIPKEKPKEIIKKPKVQEVKVQVKEKIKKPVEVKKPEPEPEPEPGLALNAVFEPDNRRTVPSS